ncbi:MAG TPA: hypothetical protein GX400_16705, partial [Chloroflexi bacterium]|nr:hypothetical protein [Chloroflexota bacterium]
MKVIVGSASSRTLPVGHIVTPEAVTYVKVIVGSASSRTLPVGHIVTPEA